MLEWLGDIGGLFEGLIYITRFLIGPLASYAMRAELLSQVFGQVHSNEQ